MRSENANAVPNREVARIVSEKLANSIIRPTRFEIRTPVHYRIRGERIWREGTTVNISKSGLLFVAEGQVDVGTRIEMKFSLPVQTGNGSGAAVSCHGVIVRSPGYAVLAAKISAPRLIRV
jgi:PilZ domain